jgi:hypothetical protein
VYPVDLASGIQRRQELEEANETAEQEQAQHYVSEILQAITQSNQKLVAFLLQHSPEVTVKNQPTIPGFPESIKTPDVQAVVDAIQAIPEPKLADHADIIAALSSLEKHQKSLNSLISKLDIKPEVKVEAPQVNVDAPDLKPVIKAIKDAKPDPVDLSQLAQLMVQNLEATRAVSTAVRNQVFKIPTVPTDPLIDYLPGDIDDAGTMQYFGYTDRRGAWYIRQFDTAASPKTIRFCFGQENYATNWSSRASLTYSRWGS